MLLELIKELTKGQYVLIIYCKSLNYKLYDLQNDMLD